MVGADSYAHLGGPRGFQPLERGSYSYDGASGTYLIQTRTFLRGIAPDLCYQFSKCVDGEGLVRRAGFKREEVMGCKPLHLGKG